MPTWEEFYAKNVPPPDLAESEAKFSKFVDYHSAKNKKVVLVTSGGTTVPLEHNTVRFVDNFSAGTRGSASAEYFLNHDYAVIFLFRIKSLEPFSRNFVGSQFLDMLELSNTNNSTVVKVNAEHTEEVSKVLKKYISVKEEQRLLQVGFTTLSDYLWLLKSACKILAPLENRALFYLAAAVSDFYIPSNEMSVHKIPSNEPPNISLQLVPKVLQPLVNSWVPKAFVISFKLETDERVLISKAREALKKYQHKLVIANMLQNRKEQVTLVSLKDDHTISLSKEEIARGEEIEKYIVKFLVEKHDNFINN